MVLAPMLIIAILCAGWAWSFQHRALRLLRQRPSHLARAGGAQRGTRGVGAVVISGPEDPGREDLGPDDPGREDLGPDESDSAGAGGAASRGADRSAEAAPRPVALAEGPWLPDLASPAGGAPASVLGWEAFAIASTLVLDGTVLIGCTRRADPDVDSPWAGPTGDRAGACPSDRATFVLLLGLDERATQAYDLLEAWRDGNDVLRLRPAPVSGAVEIYDGQSRALRAGLLAA